MILWFILSSETTCLSPGFAVSLWCDLTSQSLSLGPSFICAMKPVYQPWLPRGVEAGHICMWPIDPLATVVILTSKSTFPLRTLLAPRIPQGGLLTCDVLVKGGWGRLCIQLSLENLCVKNVRFLFCKTSEPLLCYVVL